MATPELGRFVIPITAVVGLVVGFRSSANLAAAYGVAVTATMLITTVLLAVYAREHWDWTPLKVGLIMGGFALVDLAFLVSNLLKIPQGGWFPLVLAAAITFLMTTWIAGRRYVAHKIRRGHQPLKALITSLTNRRSSEPKGPPSTCSALSEPCLRRSSRTFVTTIRSTSRSCSSR